LQQQFNKRFHVCIYWGVLYQVTQSFHLIALGNQTVATQSLCNVPYSAATQRAIKAPVEG